MLSLSKSAFASGYPSKKPFLWNKNVGKHLMKLHDTKWFIEMIQGFVGSFTISVHGNQKLTYTLITRRSWEKGGTRFNSRGIDFRGNVANFCETEQIVSVNKWCFSYLQIRGSVPLFWKQTGLTAEVEFYKPAE